MSISLTGLRRYLGQDKGLDDRSFSLLYREEVNSIYNYVGFRLGYAEAEDITADIFSKAWAKRTDYDSQKGTPKAWLWAIARHTVIDQYRKNDPSFVPLTTDLTTSNKPPDEVEQHEEYQRIYRAFVTLSELDQEIVALRFGASETNRSIARVLNMTEANVAQRLRRALKKLRVELEQP
ncbi:MAG: sigma-70 family RNA polymerase sigma factor [Chloroflexota bacterium]